MYTKMNRYRGYTIVDKNTLNTMINYTNGLVSFVNYRRESLQYLEMTDNELHRLVYGLEKLTNGQLSTAILACKIVTQILAQNSTRS